MNPWEWLTTTSSVDSVLTTLGLGALAFLFARDLILTKGQHLRRVQDLVAHHERELSEKDERIADVREASKSWEEAARIERERADKGWESLGEIALTLSRILHVLESLDLALPSAGGSPNDRA